MCFFCLSFSFEWFGYCTCISRGRVVCLPPFSKKLMGVSTFVHCLCRTLGQSYYSPWTWFDDKHRYLPVAPVARLLSSNPFGGWDVGSSLGVVTRFRICSHTVPNRGERPRRICTSPGSTIDEGKASPNLSRGKDKESTQNENDKTPVLDFPLCDPCCCVHVLPKV